MNGPVACTLLAGLCLGLIGLSPATASNAVSVHHALGMCDASAVAPLNEDLFIAADDEDNYLRVYSRHRGGAPVFMTSVSRFLGFKSAKGETDIEGAARLGDRIYWISSHGRNTKGKAQPQRQRFFATTGAVVGGAIDLRPVGLPYAGLLQDLLQDPRLAAFHLAQASTGAPKAPGALNIEGLVATPEGHLLLGFRNPIPHQRALVVPLLNPADLIDGRPARFGPPLLLDLGGLGIRSLTRWQDRYLIIAGSPGDGGVSRLYEWPGVPATSPRWLSTVDLSGLNPEAIAPVPDEHGPLLLILSDDGTRLCDGVPCKHLKDPTRKSFRLVQWPAPNPASLALPPLP